MVVLPGGAPKFQGLVRKETDLTRISTPGGGLEAVLGTLPPKQADFGGEKTCGSLTVEPEPALDSAGRSTSPRHHGRGDRGGEWRESPRPKNLSRATRRPDELWTSLCPRGLPPPRPGGCAPCHQIADRQVCASTRRPQSVRRRPIRRFGARADGRLEYPSPSQAEREPGEVANSRRLSERQLEDQSGYAAQCSSEARLRESGG